MLEDAGYDIRTFDTTDFSRSMHYNPLSYVKDQADILVFVECLIKNTTPDDRKGSDPFWENSERLLYTALVAYLVYHARPEERDLNSLMLLLSLAEAREEDESYMSPLDLIFEELETGMRFMERGRGREAREERPFDDGGDWGWVRIAEPRDPEEDFALSNYRAFKVAAGKMLALPQNQPNAPLYPAGGAPGSRPGALPHFGRPRYLGPPPRARSTAG